MKCKKWKTQSKQDWIKDHESHGGFSEKKDENSPSAYDVIYILCKCGKKFIYTKKHSEMVIS